MTMLPEKYQKLKELSEKATAKPWWTYNNSGIFSNGHEGLGWSTEPDEDTGECAPDGVLSEDLNFIAEARNQVDSVLSDLETALEALDKTSNAFGKFNNQPEILSLINTALEKIRGKK